MTDAPVAGPGLAPADHNAAAMDIMALVKEEPKALYSDPKLLPKLTAQLDEQAKTLPTDMGDPKQRDIVRSAAHAIARLKTRLDDAGKELTEDFRKRTAEVNEVRGEIKTALQAKQDDLRRPLTEWEENEKAREEKVRAFRAFLEESLKIPAGVTLEQLAKRRAKIESTAIDPDVFGELVDRVREERDAALKALDDAKARVEQEAADKAELLRLREEAAARAAKEEAERRERARAEEERIQREAAEQERKDAIARAEQEAADKARREAEERQAAALAKAEEERRAADAKAQMAIDEANRRAREAEEARAEAERQAQAEREAAAQRERDRIAAEEAAAAEERRRQADRTHRHGIMTAAKEDLMAHAKITDEQARRVVLAIVGGNVRNAKVEF